MNKIVFLLHIYNGYKNKEMGIILLRYIGLQ